jgi:orotate phosphoribosyltransferase
METRQTFGTSPTNVSASLAAGLLQIKAVEIRPSEPFLWTSGWKSPIYCDNRLVLGYPLIRELIVTGFESIVKGVFPGVDLIAGTATAGIPHASILADRLALPAAYVRGSAKGHGKQKQVEGKLTPGATALVIEDTLSTGKSAYEAVSALQAEGITVAGVCSIYSYDFEAAQSRMRESGVPAYRLLSYQQLIDVALEQGYIQPNQLEMLLAWRDAPDKFGK